MLQTILFSPFHLRVTYTQPNACISTNARSPAEQCESLCHLRRQGNRKTLRCVQLRWMQGLLQKKRTQESRLHMQVRKHTQTDTWLKYKHNYFNSSHLLIWLSRRGEIQLDICYSFKTYYVLRYIIFIYTSSPKVNSGHAGSNHP